MDRNPPVDTSSVNVSVALRKESVDRNPLIWTLTTHKISSLSARRAWIEMIDSITQGVFNLVALRKESVDRNSFGLSCVNTVS